MYMLGALLPDQQLIRVSSVLVEMHQRVLEQGNTDTNDTFALVSTPSQNSMESRDTLRRACVPDYSCTRTRVSVPCPMHR
jgi:hypothetical protein